MCTRKYLIILCVKWWLGVLLENENPTEMNWYNSSKFAKQQSCGSGSGWFSGFDPDPHYLAQYLEDENISVIIGQRSINRYRGSK